MTRICLIRHGQASAGARDYDNLSPLGHTQSQRLGAWLAEHAAPPTHVLVGPRRRHQQTWDGILHAFSETQRARGKHAALPQPTPYEALDEHHGIQLLTHAMPGLAARNDTIGEIARRVTTSEGAEAKHAYIELILAALPAWARGEIVHEAVEPWDAFMTRARAVERELQGMRDGVVWVVSSGGLISALAAHLLGLGTEGAFEMMWSMRNTAMSELTLERSFQPARDKRLTLFSFNGVPHLRGDEISFV